MNNQYQEVYPGFSNRSPILNREYTNGPSLNRQASQHFDHYAAQPLPPYSNEEYAGARYEVPRAPTMASPSVYHNFDAHTWNYGGANGAHTISGTGRLRTQGRRTGLPTSWTEPAMPPLPQAYQQMTYHTPQQMPQGQPARDAEGNGESKDDDVIYTAVVIKNIPFAVKKEALMDIMGNMGLPLPYAFNYHFDKGVFRGLAFANFTSAKETEIIVHELNNVEIQGRKLRVEYKRMLPAAERERIERDKRERRGQLQEQHQPLASTSTLRNQGSMNSITSGNPAPSESHLALSAPSGIFEMSDINLNDPATLNYYTTLLLFKGDQKRETLIFPSDVPPAHRRIIHTIAHYMGLEHRSEGSGEHRQVAILKRRPHGISSSAQTVSALSQAGASNWMNESQRRGLNRAATTDFSESRDTGYHNHTLGRQDSTLLNIPGSPGPTGLNGLRAAKSFADLRSYSPSPALTTASFPMNLGQNVSRYNEYSNSAASATPNLTPTSANAQGTIREDSFLLNGLSNLAIGHDRPGPSRTNPGRLAQEREAHSSSAGPIGSQRPINGHFEENSRNGASAVPERQPRGPVSEWSGFTRPRQNGHVNRGSDGSDRTGVPLTSSRYNI